MKNPLSRVWCWAAGLVVAVGAASAGAGEPGGNASAAFQPEEKTTSSSVTIAGRRLDYRAVAGTLIVHAKGWDDVAANADKSPNAAPAAASIFYVAYFKTGEDATHRPVTFLFNGGPGSSTVWLHMGAFGPRRIVTAGDSHTPAAPYQLVNNEFSLLDASDLVFVDAPGTGFSRVAGSDREKAFYGIDEDGHAFASFIVQFLSRYGRWNSPKFLFGESYGTTRSAVVANLLESEHAIDLNGVILLSQILNFDGRNDGEEFNPGVDLPYQLALPTFAAAAWYHQKLSGPLPRLPDLLAEVERFSMTEFAEALLAGSRLSGEQRHAVAVKLHQYTSLPVDYIELADLRVAGAQFQQRLLESSGQIIGRLDARFSGPVMDPRSRDADYDPYETGVQPAFVGGFNDYVRRDLNFGEVREYRPVADFDRVWNWQHQPPGAPVQLPRTTNVMPDLAAAMKRNPRLRILLNAGYYDLATPFYQAVYEMDHLPIPATLRGNIEYRFYESGHMVYAHAPSLQALHGNVAAFIQQNSAAAGR